MIVVTAAAVNVFVPVPLDVAGGAAEGAKAALGLVDWNSLFNAGADPAASAMTSIATDSATGAAGQATDDKCTAAVNKIKEKNGKMAKLTCSEAAKKADEAAHADSETEEGLSLIHI